MTHRLIYLVGPPGAGKSTLMARLTEPFSRIPIAPPETSVAHDQLVRELSPDEGAGGTIQIVGAEIGIRREKFSGTDALPSSIIDKAVPWLYAKTYPLLLAEGARLANRRFLEAAVDAGYQVIVALLDHDETEAWRRKRSKEIGRIQNASWVQGRVTASRNLANQMVSYPNVTVVKGHPNDLLPILGELISGS